MIYDKDTRRTGITTKNIAAAVHLALQGHWVLYHTPNNDVARELKRKAEEVFKVLSPSFIQPSLMEIINPKQSIRLANDGTILFGTEVSASGPKKIIHIYDNKEFKYE